MATIDVERLGRIAAKIADDLHRETTPPEAGLVLSMLLAFVAANIAACGGGNCIDTIAAAAHALFPEYEKKG
jgi:hypothetical protein